MGISVAGGVGVILYCCIFSVSIYQIALYLGDSRRADKGSRQYRLKLYFHIVFGFYCLLDLMYSASLYFYAKYVIWGYALHLIALLINLYAFTIVIYLWRITLDPRDIRLREQVAGFLFLGINTISTSYDLILWCTHPKKDLSDPETVTINLVYVCSILFVTCCLIVLGHQLKHRLSSSSRSLQRNEIQIKTMAILRRTNTVLVICAVCYGIRTVFLLILTLDSVGNTSPGGAVLGMPNIIWFILTAWIPTLFPGATFLYIMRYHRQSRKRKIPADRSSLASESRGDGTSSSWYEREHSDLQSPQVSVSSTHSPLKSSRSLGWEDKIKMLQFTRTTSQAATSNDMVTPLSSSTRLSFHSETSNE